MIEPMGDPEVMTKDFFEAPSAPTARRAFRRAGDAEVMTFGEENAFGDDDNETSSSAAGGVTRVRIVNETPSLLEGEFDEAANRAAFAEALREWRGGESRANGAAETEKENPPRLETGGSRSGSLLDGAFDEAANRRAFAEALSEWRGDTREREGAANAANVPAMETQTDSPSDAAFSRTTRPATAKPSAPPGASYFERLRAGNAERLAGKDAADAVRSSSSKGRK
jgi:hypothetical protein